MNIKIKDKAPDFTLPDQNNKEHTLSDYVGKWVLLYFYPKDDTPGCTKQACTIGDNYSAFVKKDIVVLGVSVDSVAKHKKFEEKYNLPFTLLSDENKKVVDIYGVWGEKKFMGKTYIGTKRNSFLISPDGVIVKIYENVKPADHAGDVLADVETFLKK